MKTNYTLTAIAVSLLLAACGGSDKEEDVFQKPVEDISDQNTSEDNSSEEDSSDEDSSDGDSGGEVPPPTYTVGGKVIDGYVSGATVWIDFNNNGVKDDIEPSAVSGDAGDYSLELTETERQCSQFSTWYVDVPVGAIDEDLGEVTEAYQMVRPPVLEAITDETLLHISPLTTALWQEIKEELGTNDISDCSALIDNQAKREEVAQLIDATIYNTVNFYNISEDEIFEDFIAEGNEDSKSLAQEIVKGLQKSLTYVAEVKKQFPSADEIRVVHYNGTYSYYTDDEKDHWFRKVAVFEGDNFYSRHDMMTASLEDVIKPIYHRDAISSKWGSGDYTLTNDIIYRGSEGYECSFNEKVSVVESETTYKLTNYGSNSSFVESIEECPESEFIDLTPDRRFSISYEQEGKSYLAEFDQPDAEGTALVLPEWVNLAGRSEELSVSDLVAELENSGYEFDEETLIDASSWYKRKSWFVDTTYYQIDYNHLGKWTKYTRFEDGTHTDECSYDEGRSWELCEE
ncbi:hypothetical protein [Alteromonas sp. ASW11-130]|uniref:hypothetical protein n=1 Tax=Alteromonas sp. ASW11-130 TaxID=3015775 RepID=UPI002242B481|nr:hypothetical protein [Alteromonas sp. ASW11-130]MCW8092667.1 hypothetical protein [Alteromonas sp. ASW11-130]